MAVFRGQSAVIDGGEDQASAFLRFNEPLDKLFVPSQPGPESGTSESAGTLSYLRVELTRIRSGMSDFLIQVSTPKAEGNKKSNVIVTIRGSKKFSNSEGATKIATVLSREMAKRGDATHTWDKANISHLGEMLAGPLKYFSGNNGATSLKFVTEALS